MGLEPATLHPYPSKLSTSRAQGVSFNFDIFSVSLMKNVHTLRYIVAINFTSFKWNISSIKKYYLMLIEIISLIYLNLNFVKFILRERQETQELNYFPN